MIKQLIITHSYLYTLIYTFIVMPHVLDHYYKQFKSEICLYFKMICSQKLSYIYIICIYHIFCSELFLF